MEQPLNSASDLSFRKHCFADPDFVFQRNCVSASLLPAGTMKDLLSPKSTTLKCLSSLEVPVRTQLEGLTSRCITPHWCIPRRSGSMTSLQRYTASGMASLLWGWEWRCLSWCISSPARYSIIIALIDVSDTLSVEGVLVLT